MRSDSVSDDMKRDGTRIDGDSAGERLDSAIIAGLAVKVMLRHSRIIPIDLGAVQKSSFKRLGSMGMIRDVWTCFDKKD